MSDHKYDCGNLMMRKIESSYGIKLEIILLLSYFSCGRYRVLQIESGTERTLGEQEIVAFDAAQYLMAPLNYELSKSKCAVASFNKQLLESKDMKFDKVGKSHGI